MFGDKFTMSDLVSTSVVFFTILIAVTAILVIMSYTRYNVPHDYFFFFALEGEETNQDWKGLAVFCQTENSNCVYEEMTYSEYELRGFRK